MWQMLVLKPDRLFLIAAAIQFSFKSHVNWGEDFDIRAGENTKLSPIRYAMLHFLDRSC